MPNLIHAWRVCHAKPNGMVSPFFFAHDMAKVCVETLNFKHIMRTFYAGRMVQAYVEDESLQDYPHIGLTNKFADLYIFKKIIKGLSARQ